MDAIAPNDPLAVQLRKQYEMGMSMYQLAEEHGMTPTRVRRYIQRAGGTMRSRGERTQAPRKMPRPVLQGLLHWTLQ